jgi:cell division protein FtsW
MQRRFVFLNVFLLVFAVVALTSLGIVMLTSTGAYAMEAKGDPNAFLKLQVRWLGVGTVLCFLAAIVDYRWLEKKWWILYVVAAALLVCCFVPGIGKTINGSKRWIRVGIGEQGFQPSEVAKLAVLVALAAWYARRGTEAKSFFGGFLVPLFGVCVLVGLIAPEVDLGTSSLILGTALLVMFVAGTRIWCLTLLACAGGGALWAAIHFMKERTGRVLAFWNPELYPDDAYQQVQGLIAFGSGGVWGLGIGNGRQKNSYLPYAHTDFIFPSVGEELGLIATLAVSLMYLVLLVSGTVIATRARDRFGKLLGFGIVTLLALQAAINIGVNTMVLPNKGLPLPFISYGGSNLAFCLACVGLLISIYRQGHGERPDPQGAVLAVKIKHRATPRL